MKTKLIISSLGLGTLFLIAVMMGGCGESISESKTYYFPNWTPDGRIIAFKEVMRTKKTWGWENPITDYKTYITTMSSDDANEADLFQVSDFDREIVCAPDGEKIGYVATTKGYIAICNYDGTGITTIEGVSGAKYFDWSPDSTKVVYTDSSRDMYVVNTDGSNKTKIATTAEVVAWRVGARIAYEDSVYNKIWISGLDGSSKEVLVATVSSRPQISSVDRIVFRGAGNQVKSINMDGIGEVELFSGYERATLKLSFDNTKIVGGDLDQQDIVGIWVVNIDGTGAKRLR